MPEITVVAGARPNFMKVAPILRALRHTSIRPRLVHTGQHYDVQMSDVFFRQLGIPAPDVHLDVGSGTHGAQTARVLESFESYLTSTAEPQRGVVVVGDVNSTMACTLAAVKLGVSVAHVEAGLRSFDRGMPEEINRLVTDAVAQVLFISEPAGVDNLRHEGVSEDRIHYVGNVMIDTLVHELPCAEALDMPGTLGLCRGGYAVVTLHRPSNVDDPSRLSALVELLLRAAKKIPVVFPLHPRTRERLCAAGLTEKLEAGVKLLNPLGYRENLGLIQSAKLVLTDSGGIQEETAFLGVPCLTLRSNTERPATVMYGTNTLVGEDLDRAYMAVNDVVSGAYRRGTAIPGWDGCAAERIVSILEAIWGDGR